MKLDNIIDKRFEKITKNQQVRQLKKLSSLGSHICINDREYVNFSSNDYLGLSQHPNIKTAASECIDSYGVGSTSSRLLSGNLEIHELLESELALMFASESALVFSSGYLANLAVINCLANKDSIIISDKLIHASLIDAINLAKARHYRFKHNNMDHLEDILKNQRENHVNKDIYIVVESLYSMDGDFADLKSISFLVNKYNAILILDEAHAAGVYGKRGNGLWPDTEFNCSIIRTFTMSKAFGSYGGVVLCNNKLRSVMISSARTFIYNTALPAVFIASSLAAINEIKSLKHADDLHKNISYFQEKQAIKNLNINTISQIIPIYYGNINQIKNLSESMLEAGLIAPVIISPTVAKGKERIRISITARHTTADIDRLLDLL
ncbi:MAG: 8-amino-7-oxononanoate synthase [Proteobacteria bacterium]|nr:8-amino-7-oxononanoate synthase [Pseudomonadota bacterium]